MSRTLHRGDNVSGGAREKGRERERDEKGRERKCISLPRDTSRDETNVFSSTIVFLEVHRIFFPNLLCLVSPSLRWKNDSARSNAIQPLRFNNRKKITPKTSSEQNQIQKRNLKLGTRNETESINFKMKEKLA